MALPHLGRRIHWVPPGLGSDVPLAVDGDASGRRQLVDPLKQRARRGGDDEGQVVIERCQVDAPRHLRVLEDRLDLRAEQNPAGKHGVIEGLDADPIAHQEELPMTGVPDRQCEHALEAAHEVGSLFLIEMNECFRVGARSVGVTLRLQLFPQAGVVVDLSVEGNPDRAVLVRHRLSAGGRQIDDRQPPVREAHLAVG